MVTVLLFLAHSMSNVIIIVAWLNALDLVLRYTLSLTCYMLVAKLDS